MKQTIQYIVYCIEPVKKITGFLGNIDMYIIQLLLLGGKKGIEETTDTKNPIEWYTTILEEQGMTVKSSHMQVLKGIKRVWIEIDNCTPISEYTVWSDVESNDTDTLAWKPFWVPCLEGTMKESIGLNVVARETPIFSGKYPVTVYDILTTVLM